VKWREPIPERFWGPEQLSSAAFVELVELLDASAEVTAILRALDGMMDVVDVGGGTGFLTQQIAQRAAVTVIEPSAEQRAHVPAGITVREGRAEALPLGDRSIDAAIATWVLQYCDDPLRAVDEMARVARRRVVIVQAAPENDLVEIYNREAEIAGQPRAHHGYLLSHATTRLLSRLHFAEHPRRAEMIAATEPLVAERLAANGALADDGALLVAYRRE